MQRAWDRYDRLSVASAVTLSPKRRRVGAFFSIQEENIRTDDVVLFLQRLRARLRRPLIICWDRWSVHKAAATRLAGRKGFDFEPLPSCAPELNPVEAMWSHTKYSDLANVVPDDVDHLEGSVRDSLDNQSRGHHLK